MGNLLDEATIDLSLVVENYYEDADPVTTCHEVSVPPPASLDPYDDEFDDWQYEHIFPLTGTGHTDGDSAYFVTVVSSSDPEALPAGTKFEFGL